MTTHKKAHLLFGVAGVQEEEEAKPKKAHLLFGVGVTPTTPVEEEDDKNDLLQTGAGVLEGILDPLSVIPFVDRKMQQLEQYRGSSTGGKIGYGIGAIAGFMLPAAPANLALRAGTAAARGLKLVKTVENSEDVIKLADKMVNLNRAGEFVQGAVSGGLIGLGTGEGLVETDSRVLDALQGAAFGGIADVAISPIWRAISGIGKTTKTLPPEVKAVAEKALETGPTDNAPVIANERTATLVGRALALADNVLGEPDLEAKTGLGLNIAKALKSVEEGELRVVPSIGKNHGEFVKALQAEGLDVVEAHGPNDVSSFLIGAKGTLSKELSDEFAHYGFVKGQSVISLGGKTKGTKGTVLGPGEKAGSVKVLLPGKRVKELAKEDVYFLPSGYTKATQRSIGKASSLWGEFRESFENSFSSNVLANEAEQLGIISGEFVKGPPRLSFDGAFEKFASEKGVTGAQRVALKDYFVRRQEEGLRKFANEEVEILNALKAMNKDAHPEGALVEMAGLSGYKVYSTTQNGKRVYGLRDIETGDAILVGSKKDAMALAKSRGRELRDGLEGLPLPVSNDLLNTGGVAASIDEAGREPMLSPKTIAEIASQKGAAALHRATRIIPRLQHLLGIEEIAAKNGESFPIWSGVGNVLSEANTKWVNRRSPYLNEAVKISRGFFTKNIRPEKEAEWVRLMESNPKEWDRLATELDLNKKEVVAAGKARQLFNKVWENEAAEVGMTADQYLEFYWPRMREFSQKGAETGETFADYLRREAADRGFKATEKDIGFFNDLHRTGQLTEYETNPLVVMTRYINGITFKSSGAADDYKRAIDTFNGLVSQYKNHRELAPHLVVARDYTRLIQGQLPEVEGTVNNVMEAVLETTGMSKHLDQQTAEKFANLWVGLNYGAFMGFRVATAVMNATQIGHVYMKQGAKYTAYGIKAIMQREMDRTSGAVRSGMDEVFENGAARKNHMRIPFEDQVRRNLMERQLKGGDTVVGKAADLGLAAAEFGGVMFSKTDEWLRGIAYHAQKIRATEAFNKYKNKGWDGFSRNQAFEEEAGLTQLGEVITQQYFKKLHEGNDAAAKWLGAKSANETQFMYQGGTGPIAFSRGAMKLFGQYGTWPAWYIDFARRGLQVGTRNDKIKFAMRGAAFSGGLIAAGYATGVSTTRWHGPTSIFFAGGPIWDKTKDATTIWGGIARPGGPPLDTRITLAEYGIKYDEDSLLNYEMNKPGKFLQNTVGQIIPGQGAVRDVQQGLDVNESGGSIYESLMTGLGFHMEDD